MKFKTINKEDLETMPFDDIAYIILKEKGKKMKINDIFKIICDELNLGEDAFENQIADFFALLATEKRFIQLEKGYWDLRENHTAEINIKDIEEELEDDELTEEKEDEDIEEHESDFYDDIDETDDDDTDDDLRDLVIVDEGYEDESDL
ncbi:MAG: DNA-directed RNA polymerase subunit delta [Bacilli bacterium]